VAAVTAGGVDRSRICIDPGIGFGKTFTHNLDLLAGLDRFAATGLPVLVGPSRKGFLGTILESAGRPTGPEGRDPATGAAVALAIAAGVTAVRVHDVVAGHQIGRTADAIVRRSGHGTSGWSNN
jgi:dihydropteroate synthase